MNLAQAINAEWVRNGDHRLPVQRSRTLPTAPASEDAETVRSVKLLAAQPQGRHSGVAVRILLAMLKSDIPLTGGEIAQVDGVLTANQVLTNLRSLRNQKQVSRSGTWGAYKYRLTGAGRRRARAHNR